MLKSKSFSLSSSRDKHQRERDLLYEPRRIRWNRYIVILLLIGFSLLLILSNVNFSGESYEMVVVASIEMENPAAEVGTSTTSDNYETKTTADGSTAAHDQSDSELGEDREKQEEKVVIGVQTFETVATQVSITGFRCNDNRTCKTIICTGQLFNSIAIEQEMKYFIQYCGNQYFDVIIEDCVFYKNNINIYMFSGSYRLNTLTIRNSQLQTIADSAFDQTTMNKLVNLTFEGVQLKSLSEKTFLGLQTVKNFTLINAQQTENATLTASNFLQPMAANLSIVILQQTQEQCNCQTIYDPTDWLGDGSDTLYKKLLFVDLSGTNFNYTLNNRTFSKLVAVQQLRLANCNLSVIDENVFTGIIHALEHLDLRGNRLQRLDGEFLALAILNNVTIEMSSNLWCCDCENTGLVDYMQQVEEQYAIEVVCATPVEVRDVQIRYVQLNCNGLITTTNVIPLTRTSPTTTKPTGTIVDIPTTTATSTTAMSEIPITTKITRTPTIKTMATTASITTTTEILTTRKTTLTTTTAEPQTKPKITTTVIPTTTSTEITDNIKEITNETMTATPTTDVTTVTTIKPTTQKTTTRMATTEMIPTEITITETKIPMTTAELTTKTTTTLTTEDTRKTETNTTAITERITTITEDPITTTTTKRVIITQTIFHNSTLPTSLLTTTISPLDTTTTSMVTTTPWITATPTQMPNTTTINTEITSQTTLNTTMIPTTANITRQTPLISTTTTRHTTTVPQTTKTTTIPETTTTTTTPNAISPSSTVKPPELCYQNKPTKFLVCSYKIAVSLCDYDVVFNVTTISPKSVQLHIGSNASGFAVIYFPAINCSSYEGLAVLNNSTIDIGDLTSNQSYIFCLLPIGWLTTSPFNCRSAYLPQATPKSWLSNNDIAIFFTITIFITVLCVIVGVAAVYFLLRWRPTLMYGSKRLRRLASTSHEVLLFPKPERKSLDSQTYAMNELSKMPSSVSDTLTPENCLNIKSYDYMQYFRNHELNKKQTNVAYISYIRPPDNRAPALPSEARSDTSGDERACNSYSGYIPVRQLSQQSTVIMENESKPLKSCLRSGSRQPNGAKVVEFENEYESLDYYQEIY